MLQIISGRFFGNGQIEELESDAVLYSNLSWVAPIKTQVAELRPIDGPGRAVAAYAVRYINRYEKWPNDRMVLASADEAVDQFRLLCSFWFRAFFHVDRNHVEMLCRAGPRNAMDKTIPRAFVPRFFEPALMTTAAEVKGFVNFISRVLMLPRQKYKLLVSCLGVFFDALEALGTNFDLAYSMLVYLLEAIAQEEDGYVPTWEDYDPQVKGMLDTQLVKIDAEAGEAIRRALLESSHLKLTKRFVDFLVANVTDEFFTTQAEGLTRPLPRSRLERSLRNLYKSRSGFVHRLKKVREQLRHPWTGPTFDVFDWENEPYLTFPGLVRLTHHVLSTFISSQQSVDREEYPAWRNELPGTMQVEMAPRYWIWRADGFKPADARRRLSGLFAHIVEMLTSTGKSLIDMAAVMDKIEQFAKGCSQEDRTPMLSLYQVYHLFAPRNHRPGWRDFISQFQCDLEKCSIEQLAYWPLLLNPPGWWPIQDCVAAFTEYQKKRHSPTAFHLPVLIEVVIMAAIANLFLEDGDPTSFVRWVDLAILEAAGRKPVQDVLIVSRREFRLIDTRHLVGLPPAHEPVEEPDDAPTLEPPDASSGETGDRPVPTANN